MLAVAPYSAAAAAAALIKIFGGAAGAAHAAAAAIGLGIVGKIAAASAVAALRGVVGETDVGQRDVRGRLLAGVAGPGDEQPAAEARPAAGASAAIAAHRGRVLDGQVADVDHAGIDEQAALVSLAVQRRAIARDVQRDAGLQIDRLELARQRDIGAGSQIDLVGCRAGPLAVGGDDGGVQAGNGGYVGGNDVVAHGTRVPFLAEANKSPAAAMENDGNAAPSAPVKLESTVGVEA